MIAASDLRLSRGDRTLFEGLAFEARAGEAVALVGANGAGKTSLLRAIAGLLRPEAGTIVLGDPEPALHLIGHQDGLKGGRTVTEELGFWTRWHGGTDVAGAIERFDLGRLAELEVRRLSAGQRRRLALARLDAAPRPLWLLDEPMAPLDVGWRARVGALMAEHIDGGGTIVAAVHDPLPIPHRTVQVGAA